MNIVDVLKQNDEGVLDQKTPSEHLDYRRFYTTLTGIWLAVESWKLLKASSYHLASTRQNQCERVRKLWAERKSLRELLEALELSDFLYVFLLYHMSCLDIEHLIDFIPVAHQNRDPDAYYRSGIISELGRLLTPADVLELLQQTTMTTPFRNTQPKHEFLQVRGLYDERPRQHAIQDVGGSIFWNFSLHHLEDGRERRVAAVHDEDDYVVKMKWQKCRLDLWPIYIHGRFNDVESRFIGILHRVRPENPLRIPVKMLFCPG